MKNKLKLYETNEKDVSDWNNYSKEIHDFNHGKSKYVKGKCWQQ